MLSFLDCPSTMYKDKWTSYNSPVYQQYYYCWNDEWSCFFSLFDSKKLWQWMKCEKELMREKVHPSLRNCIWKSLTYIILNGVTLQRSVWKIKPSEQWSVRCNYSSVFVLLFDGKIVLPWSKTMFSPSWNWS